MAEHGIAVELPQPAKNSPAACRSAGAGHCLMLSLDMSWLLVVMSACFYPLRRASKSVRRSAYGAPYRRFRAAGCGAGGGCSSTQINWLCARPRLQRTHARKPRRTAARERAQLRGARRCS
jgi:hypothetical protein